MNNNWLTYWKKSLSDSLKADIDIEKSDYFEIEQFNISQSTINELKKVNKLIDTEEIRINKKKGITSKDHKDWIELNYLQILIAPFKLKPTTEHQVYLKDKKPKFPFWYTAQIDRSGHLNIPLDTFPVFQRKYLEPLADERTEFIFASVDEVDLATALGKEEFDNYCDYIKYIRKVFRDVVLHEIDEYQTEGHETIPNGIILLPDEEINAAIGIIQLYEKLLQEEELPLLLKTFSTLNHPAGKQPLDVDQFIESNFLHVGQMGDNFPISISQRKALYTFLQANNRVFAVNGPPGTGKTTLLQSVVANKVVEHVIEEKDAPVILACSTNNQAVTNIIESFSKVKKSKDGVLYDRWLPDIQGYATYLPSNVKTEKELEGINYKKQTGEGLFGNIENETYLQEAKTYYLDNAAVFFDSPAFGLKAITVKLREKILHIQSQLKKGSSVWKKYLEREQLFIQEYLNDISEKQNYYNGNLLNKDNLQTDIESLENTEKQILSYFKNEPFLRRVFCFLGLKFALNKRTSEIRIILRDSLFSVNDSFAFTQEAVLQQIDGKIELVKSIIQSINNWEKWKSQNLIHGNPPRTEEEYWDFEYAKMKPQSSIMPNCFYDELDVSLRYEAFQLALRYWEGEYLIKLENDLSGNQFEKKGLEPNMNRWKRHAMVTPCFVSTFFMAPKFFNYYKYLRKSDDGKNLFDTPALLSFIDLLIVDEAGQVSPEVGVATFSLAKQTLIVGDIKQIEPVWNITHKIDVGNLRKNHLIKDYNDLRFENEYDPKGFLASTGSIMKMAQNACNVKDESLTEKGALLVEHRRCYNEIINYCNELAYNGQLKPLKGKAECKVLFPPMYCIHVEGNSTVLQSSRQNEKEALAIADWLQNNKDIIVNKYNKSIEEAVGIITPFTGQKKCLQRILKQKGFNVDKMKIGTVHALQGAERKVVLFSMVYGEGDSGTMFFDRDNKPNMLNVAVSRAEDNFIVFANTKILNRKSKTPSGVLAKYLTFEDV